MSNSRASAGLTWLRADVRRFDAMVAVLTVGLGAMLTVAAPERFDTGWPEVAAGVGAFVLLLFRSRWPWPLFVISVAWGAAHVAILQRPTLMFFALLVLLATVCVRMDRRPSVVLGIVVAGCLYVTGIVVNDAAAGDSRAVIGIAWSAVAVGVADAVRSWRRYKESADAQIRAAVLASDAQARQQVSHERLTIARELHDLLAHNLSVMNVQTGAALHLLRTDPDEAETSLTAARDAGRSVLDELRDLLAVLRHEDADGAPVGSLPTVDEIAELVETMRRAGLHVEWSQIGAARPLAPSVSLAAYRITQEALTNAAKHGTGSATVATEFDDAGWSVRVSNEVTSEEPTAGGLGLVGMRERADANGGRFDGRVEDGGFVVEAWLPTAPRGDASS